MYPVRRIKFLLPIPCLSRVEAAGIGSIMADDTISSIRMSARPRDVHMVLRRMLFHERDAVMFRFADMSL